MQRLLRPAALTIFAGILIAGLAVGAQNVRPGRGVGNTPLNDLGTGTYLTFQGGLYENGTNVEPSDHAVAGYTRATAIVPLATNGAPAPGGKIVLLSIGLSNTTQEWCSAAGTRPCDSWTFTGQAEASPDVNHTSLVIVNGARGGQTPSTWDSPTDTNYDRVRDVDLAGSGVTEAQVQVAWVKEANATPTLSLPDPGADAYSLETGLGNMMRAMKTRYPNLKLVFLTSRIYAGYASTTLNPEPYAYESGFAVKWLIQAQIDQMRNGGTVVDTRAGNLNYNTVAPWIAWGPYLWADGLNPRSDGLTWASSEFESDGTHPSQTGEQKVGTNLLNFFRSSGFTSCWFWTDTDADGRADFCDNCPQRFNPAQDFPAWGVSLDDTDCDGFAPSTNELGRASEAFMGTDPLDSCADTTTPNDERGPAFGQPVSPWGVDVNDDRRANLTDVLAYIPLFGSAAPGPPYGARHDLTADNLIGLQDILTFIPFFNVTCIP